VETPLHALLEIHDADFCIIFRGSGVGDVGIWTCCGVEFDMVGHIVAHTSVTPVVYDGEKDLEWRRQSREELVFSKADSRSSSWRFHIKGYHLNGAMLHA
jgi:hypothetical protein